MKRSKYNVRIDKAGKVPESGVLRACLDLLAAEKIWHERRNVGAMKIGKRFTRFSRPGTADILASVATFYNRCHFLWIECKSDSGKQTEHQKEFQREVAAAGHTYLLIRDVGDLKSWLDANL